MNLKFEKEDNGNWYIVLPNWPYDHSALQMVAGADKLLDTFNDGSNLVTLAVYTHKTPGADFRLKRLFKSFGGAVYQAKTSKYNGPIWLCEVTKFVFNNTLPKRIYFKEI